jgi:putative lipoprotein
MMVFGHNVQYVILCGSQEKYWLETDRITQQRYIQLVQRPYQSIYTELTGELMPATLEQAKSGYALNVKQQGIHYMDANASCESAQHNPKTMIAKGSAPNWQSALTGSELLVVTGQEQRQYTVNAGYLQSGLRQWTNLDAGLSLQLESAECIDTNAHTYTDQHAMLTIKNDTLRGCARLRRPQIGESLQGYFNGVLYPNNAQLDLTLESDYRATIRRTSKDGEALTQSGYWYPSGTNQFNLILTSVTTQPSTLPQQQTFVWDGEQLTRTFPENTPDLRLLRMNAPAQVTQTAPVRSRREFSPQTLRASSQFNPDVEQTLLRYFTLHRTDPAGTRYLWWRFDLNGDGQDEILTLMNWCRGQACTLLVFEPSDSGYRYVSRTTQVPSPLYISRQQHHGWQDLLVYVDGVTGHYVSLPFDGVSYPLQPYKMRIQSEPLPLSGISLSADLKPGWGRPLRR